MFTINRPRLSEFYVLCPKLCEKEGDEHKKVLYCFPQNRSLNDLLNSVGLCEAAMSFTNYFDSTCLAVHTTTTRRFFHPMTPAIWVIMVVALPTNSSNPTTPSDFFPLEQESNLNDSVIDSVLTRACQTFQFFNGQLDVLLSTEGVDGLKTRLEHFFSRYLRTMLFDHFDLLDCFHGIQYTSTEPVDFARVQGLVNRIKFAFRSVAHSAFFYDGRLVHSTLDMEYTRHLYHYLNSFLFVQRPDFDHNSTENKTKHLGRYIVGPKNLSYSTEPVQCPVLCSPGSKLPDSQLVTYQALRTVICIVVRGLEPIPMDFFTQFDAMFGPRLTRLAERLTANQSSSLVAGSVFPIQMSDENALPSIVNLSALGSNSTTDESIQLAAQDIPTAVEPSKHVCMDRSHFIYWNPFTLAMLSTLHVYTGSGRRSIVGAKSILDVIASLRTELQFDSNAAWHEEMVVRLDPFMWLVIRRSNGRELYLLIVCKKDSFTRLSSYIDGLYSTTFRGLFLLD